MTDLTWRFVDVFGVTDPSRPFRILPVGKYSRFGRNVDITPEKVQQMAANFGKVPNTPLPINREHMPEMGKLGDIVAVEARPDGLYATPSWTEAGLRAVQGGEFQFFSPEIKWGPTDYDGAQVSNVLIGLALTNTPFFGKDTALYSLTDAVDDYRDFTPEMRREMAQKGMAMPDGSYPIENAGDLNNAVQAWGRSPDEATKRHIIKRAKALGRTDLLPADWPGSTKESKMSVTEEVMEALQKYGLIKKVEPVPAPEPIKVEETEAYKLQASQLAEANKKLAEQEKTQRVADNTAKYSTAVEVKGWETPKDVPQQLAAVAEFDAALADGLAQQFKALAEQASAGELFSEKGTSQPGGGSDAQKFVAMSEAKAKELQIPVTEAFTIVAAEQPSLYKAYTEDSIKRSRA